MQSMTHNTFHAAVKTIQPSGILNSTTAHQVQLAIDQAFQAGVKQIAIDCQDITFMDVAGLGGLVVALKQARKQRVKLCLCSVSDQVEMVLDLTGVNHLFEIFTDYSEFSRAMMSELN